MRASSSFFVRSGLALGAVLLAVGGAGPGIARAQYQNPGSPIQPDAVTPGTSPQRPRFSVDATLQLNETGRPTIRLDYRMSRSELLFERTPPAGYRAAYEVRVIFFREKGESQVTGDTYTRELRAQNYTETRQRAEDIADHVDFELPPGKYRVQVAVTDLVAERISATAVPIEVPAAPLGLVWFSDLTLGLVDTVRTAPTTSFAPHPSRRYGDNIVGFAATGEIFDRRSETAEATYRLYYKVASESGEQVVAGDTTIARHGARTPFLIRPRLVSVGPGPYRFSVAMNVPPKPGSKEKTSTLRRDKNFEVDESRATVGFASTQSVEVLRYVATEEENSEIGKLKDEDARKAFWDAFWRRRDPTPETPENEARDAFYQRVQYANQHFGVGGPQWPGWKSDMGRIYIVWGPPDEVTRSPFNFDRPPEEIWYYYRDHKAFVFTDPDGFGRYELPLGTP